MYRIHSNVHFIELNRSKDSEELDLPKLEYIDQGCTELTWTI